MTTPLNIDSIKDEYRDYLKTERGRKDLQIAVKMKRMWANQEQTCVVFTKYIKNIPEIEKEMVKIEILPVAVNNLCHSNAEYFEEKYGYKKQLGFSIMSCKCGKLTTMEIHTVNKIDGKLYDFTKDYNNEIEKWFYPIPNEKLTIYNWIAIFGKDDDAFYINKGCKCSVYHTPMKINKSKDFKQFKDRMEMVRRITVW